MRWGIFSDVHANIDALEEVLKGLKDKGAQSYICCGDLVGYGPDPNPVIEQVSKLPNLLCVRGNHDLALLGRMDLEWFNDAAVAAVKFSQKTIKPENFAWLKELPPRIDREGFTIVHGSPRNTAEEYLVTVQQFHDNVSYYTVSPCFVGHSHLPVCFLMKEPVSYVEAGTLSDGQVLKAPEGMRSVINPGAVGQPRDHDNRASYGIYDDETREFTLHRVEYDVEAVQGKIRKAGLPEFLALRLAYGQ